MGAPVRDVGHNSTATVFWYSGGLLYTAALSVLKRSSYHPGLGCVALRADVLIPQE